jgi:hypothetical protein
VDQAVVVVLAALVVLAVLVVLVVVLVLAPPHQRCAEVVSSTASNEDASAIGIVIGLIC